MANRAWLTFGWSWAAVASLASLACGGTERDEASPEVAGDAGQAGAPASAGAGGRVAVAGAGAGGQAGGGAPPQDPSDAERLKACMVEQPCDTSVVQRGEGSPRVVQRRPATVCTLEALRDRRPGRYLHETNSSHTSGVEGRDHVVVVSGSGEVAHAETIYVKGLSIGGSTPSSVAQRCRLKPPSYFSGCLAALQVEGDSTGASDEAWQCLFGSMGVAPGPLPWLENCERASVLTCDPPT